MSSVDRIHLTSGVVYIAGVECPVESIIVSCGEGEIPSMTLSLPASNELVRFGEEDRVPVAAFYLDQWYSESGNPKDIIPQMRLLFDGEIVGWNYTKTPNGDYINFSCTANISMLSKMYANFLIGATQASQSVQLDNFSTTTGITTGDFKSFPLILLNKGLFAGSVQALERPFDFIQNMLLATKIGGYPNTRAIGPDGRYTREFRDAIAKAENQTRIIPGFFAPAIDANGAAVADTGYISSTIVPSVMGFFVMYNQRVRFDRRWIATPLEKFIQADNDTEITDPAKFRQSRDPRFAAIRSDIFSRAVQHSLESLFGQGDSFLKVLTTFYSMNNYEIMMLPTAPYVLVDRDAIESWGGGGQSAYIPTFTVSPGPTSQFRLGNYVSKPVSYFALPPECNILFPGLTATITFTENYEGQATRSMAGNPFLDFAKRQGRVSESDNVAQTTTVIAWPFDLSVLVSASAGAQFSSMLLYPEEFFKGPTVNSITIPSWYTALREGAGSSHTTYAAAQDKVNKDSVNNKPPPDLKALTDTILSNTYTAEEALAFADAANRRGLLTDDQKTLLFLKYVRATHFEQRFSLRQGQTSGPFNPYLLPCHPFVYLDVADAGMHISGYISKMQHSLSAVTGSNTSISYTYGRTLKEVYEIAIGTHFNLMSKNATAFDFFHSAAPIDPVETVANVLQVDDAAAAYYKQTYYQNPDSTTSTPGFVPSKDYVFKFSTYFETTDDPYGKADALPSSTTLTTSGSYDVELTLLENNIDNLLDYNKGMQRVARPICTLDQYVRFINGGSSGVQTQNINEANKAGTVPANVYGVAVPRVIRAYVAGGSPAETEALNHYIVPTGTPPAVVYDLRRDWAAKIAAYSAKMYNRIIQ